MAPKGANMKKEAGSWFRFLWAAALLASTGIFLRARSRAEILPPRQELASLPLRHGDWVGTNLGISQDVRDVLGDGDFLSRVYQRARREPYVDLFIAYFPSQRTGSTIHSPQNCLPGSGWTPLERSRIPLPAPGGKSIGVNRYVVGKGMERELVLYWYQAHGRVVASEYWAKFFLVADTIRLNRSDGALVRILTPIAGHEGPADAQGRAAAFWDQWSPLLEASLPK